MSWNKGNKKGDMYIIYMYMRYDWCYIILKEKCGKI